MDKLSYQTGLHREELLGESLALSFQQTVPSFGAFQLVFHRP